MIKKILLWIVLFIMLLFLISIFFDGGEETKKKIIAKEPTKGELDEWAKIRASDTPQFAEEWSTPMYLNISDFGWVDSLHVSGDGKTIYYQYYHGKDILTDIENGKFEGTTDIYMSEFPFTTQKPVNKYFLTEPVWGACCIQIDADGNYWYASNREARPGGWVEGKYDLENIFRNDERLPFNEKDKNYGNPFYCKAKDELWFDCPPDQAICVLKNAAKNNFTGEPQLAPYPINRKTDDTVSFQPYLTPDCNTMYFTSNRGDVPSNGPAIYKSIRITGEWSAPVPVAWSKIGLGEPTLTDDGKKLFFVQLFKNSKGANHIGAFYAERK